MSADCLRVWRRPGGVMLSVIAAALLAGCATGPQVPGPSFLAKDTAPAMPSEPKETSDPMEAVNRKVFETNQAFNHAVIYPVAKGYRDTVPEPVRDRVDAFFTNLSEPLVFANNVLQARPDAAMTTLARFVTNSTVGWVGFSDVAATVGQEHQTGDLGQTLYVWGVQELPYLVLPVVGPTNVRDAVASGVEMLTPSQAIPMLPTKLATLMTNEHRRHLRSPGFEPRQGRDDGRAGSKLARLLRDAALDGRPEASGRPEEGAGREPVLLETTACRGRGCGSLGHDGSAQDLRSSKAADDS